MWKNLMWSAASHVLIAQAPMWERPSGSCLGRLDERKRAVRMAEFNASAVAKHA